jgi:predicted nucleotidyltransferase component of viral defense system
MLHLSNKIVFLLFGINVLLHGGTVLNRVMYGSVHR